MYAIVEIAGQQFKVEKDRKVYVHRLTAEEGAQVEFDKVLLVDNEGDIKIGTPVVEGAKVVIFKKKRRKGYCKKNGHRQCMTQIQIEAINA